MQAHLRTEAYLREVAAKDPAFTYTVRTAFSFRTPSPAPRPHSWTLRARRRSSAKASTPSPSGSTRPSSPSRRPRRPSASRTTARRRASHGRSSKTSAKRPRASSSPRPPPGSTRMSFPPHGGACPLPLRDGLPPRHRGGPPLAAHRARLAGGVRQAACPRGRLRVVWREGQVGAAVVDGVGGDPQGGNGACHADAA